ncbi:chemotaxis-specific protein-glutamate methyltransferase CheB [uncultured Erythrobacter sp.]|uniref:chemotaxis-specific protein-glutamate methyltransferase CheB n=1 Tax=uncultured Erythrobacter sp. TaxID=263913 RepID=UPI002617C63E|nr:chemotaxis-specific protein-glutamate methyltransferase CheB [uncultured Erythrobacter sp.]
MNAPASSPFRKGRARTLLKPRIRVMIVDDSLTVRTIFRRMVESETSMEIAGTASSGERAIAQIKDEPADVVLLDLEMPGMGGLDALPALLDASPGTQILVVSSLTEDGAEATIKALSGGAADTLQKPRPGGFTEEYRSQLLGKIKALGRAPKLADGSTQSDHKVAEAETTKDQPAEFHAPLNDRPTKRPDVIAIGASTGGIHALNLMLRELSSQCSLPILITQHLPSNFIPVFARQIEVASGRPTKIAEDGIEIRRGEIAIAAGHGHMCVRRIAGRLVVRTSSEPTSSGCLPSVDPMLRSLAKSCDGRVLAILLSGMGRDGFEGAEELVESGGAVWAQDAKTCAVWGMPGAVAKGGLASMIAPPEKLGQSIMNQYADARSVAG